MKKLKLLSIFTLVAFAILALAPSVTFAQEDTDDSRMIERLEMLYGRLQEVSARGEERLTKAEEIAAKAGEIIINLQTEGHDTTALEDALALFETAVDEAWTAKASGDALLDAHAGFDDNGHVTDVQLANETVRDVQDAFKNGRRTFREGARQLRHAFRDFRRGQ